MFGFFRIQWYRFVRQSTLVLGCPSSKVGISERSFVFQTYFIFFLNFFLDFDSFKATSCHCFAACVSEVQLRASVICFNIISAFCMINALQVYVG